MIAIFAKKVSVRDAYLTGITLAPHPTPTRNCMTHMELSTVTSQGFTMAVPLLNTR
jgi:hypothetical protein